MMDKNVCKTLAIVCLGMAVLTSVPAVSSAATAGTNVSTGSILSGYCRRRLYKIPGSNSPIISLYCRLG